MATPRNRSISKAFALLNALRDSEGWISGTQLIRRAKLPDAYGYRLMLTLVDLGMLARGPDGYRLGLGLLGIAPSASPEESRPVADNGSLPGNSHDFDAAVHLATAQTE